MQPSPMRNKTAIIQYLQFSYVPVFSTARAQAGPSPCVAPIVLRVRQAGNEPARAAPRNPRKRDKIGKLFNHIAAKISIGLRRQTRYSTRVCRPNTGGRVSLAFQHRSPLRAARSAQRSCSSMSHRSIIHAVAAVILLCGCRAPAPSFNAFAPFGSSRVPPPPTSVYQHSGQYYQAPASGQALPNQNTGTTVAPNSGSAPASLQPPPANLVSPPALGAIAPVGSLPGFVGVGNSPGGSVAPASYQAPVAVRSHVANGPGAAVLPPSTTASSPPPGPASNAAKPATPSSSSKLKLKGMPVNDATQIDRPAAQVMPPGAPVEISQLPPASGNRVSSLLHIVRPNGAFATNGSTATGRWQPRPR